MKLLFSITTVVYFLSFPVWLSAQEVYEFTLRQAIDYAMENNYEVIYSEKNIEAAKQQMREATAIGLPQIDGALDYSDNIVLPTNIIPGEFFGQPGQDVEIQFGTKYSMNAGLFASQLLFDGRYIVGLQTAKIFMEKANVDFFRDKIAVVQQVANAYYDVLSVKEGFRVVDTTLSVTKKLAEETRMTYEVGFAEDVDVDQLELLVVDLEANQVYLKNQMNVAQAFLKFYLGIESQDSIVLLDDMTSLIEMLTNSSIINRPFDFNQNPEYASMSKQKEIRYMQLKLEKTAYMPTLNATINLQTTAFRNEWDFLDSKGQWFPSSVFGVSLFVPIWSSGERRAKVKQAEIAFEQMGILQEQLKTSLGLQYQAAYNEYLNAYQVYLNKDKARKVAEKILRTTSVKFQEGMAGSLDILNTQNQFLEAEQAYINSGLSLLKAGEELRKLLAKTETP